IAWFGNPIFITQKFAQRRPGAPSLARIVRPSEKIHREAPPASRVQARVSTLPPLIFPHRGAARIHNRRVSRGVTPIPSSRACLGTTSVWFGELLGDANAIINHPPQERCFEGECHGLPERPNLSDGCHEARRLQQERTSWVRCK